MIPPRGLHKSDEHLRWLLLRSLDEAPYVHAYCDVTLRQLARTVSPTDIFTNDK